nr:TonB-dependent receptor plug domain-containing protein [Shewanella psychropiezotolerans]
MSFFSLKKSAITTRCALFFLALPSLSVQADDQANSITSNSLERMIITGSRGVERIDEVPSSITLIDNKMLTQDMLVSSELQNILAFRVPGMAPSTGSSSNSGQTLRGRQALIMIDGVPQSTPLRNGLLGIRSIDAGTIERIEVIKGATSIYGNGASGGIINYITKKASSEDKARIQIGASSKFSAVKFEDTPGYRFDASIDGTVDNFSYVVNAAIEETGLQRDSEGDVIGLKYGLSESKSRNLFTKFGYSFDEEKYLQLTYNYYDSQQETDYVDVVGSVNTGIKTYAIKDTSGNPRVGKPQGPRGNHNLMLKYVDEDILTNTQLTLDGYAQIIENMFYYSTVLSNPSEGYAGGQSLIKSDKKGLRVNFNTQIDWDDIEVSFIYGLDALKDVSSQPLDDGRIWVPEMDMTNLAAYLQTKIVFYDDWIIKTGIRQDSVNVSVDDYQTLKMCKDANTCSVPMDVKGGILIMTPQHLI